MTKLHEQERLQSAMTGAASDVMVTQYTQHLQATQRAQLTIRRYLQSIRALQAAHPILLKLTAAQLRKQLAQSHTQGMAPRSLATQVAAWRSFYNWAQRRQLRQDNPCVGLRAPKIPKSLPKAFSVDVAENYFGKAGETQALSPPPHPLVLRDQAVLELLYACGLRAAELLSLDAHPSRDSVGYLDCVSGHVYVTGKGSKQRVLPIIPVALTALQAWLAVRHEVAQPTEAALFVGTRGGRMGGTELRRITQRQVVKKSFNQPVHPHMLRHSFASHMLQSSGDLRAVQELLGHTSIASTQVYTQLDFQHLTKIYDEKHPRAKRVASRV